jgi:hypothetical protein
MTGTVWMLIVAGWAVACALICAAMAWAGDRAEEADRLRAVRQWDVAARRRRVLLDQLPQPDVETTELTRPMLTLIVGGQR